MSTETILYIILAGVVSIALAVFMYGYRSKQTGSLRWVFGILRFITLFLILLLIINPKFKSGFIYSLGGFSHGILQAILILFSFYLLNQFNPVCDCYQKLLGLVFIIPASFVIGFIGGGFLFGLYLIIANFFLGNHDNEAYSSLKWTGYKNFLRFHLTKDTLTIYPIGVRKVSHWKMNDDSFSSGNNTKYELIESPISIKL